MFGFFVLLMCFGVTTSEDTYQTYFLEKNCGNGNMNVSMTESGPSSSGILKASNSLEMRCKVTLLAPPQHFVLISLSEAGFQKDPHGICKNYLEVDGKLTCEAIHGRDEKRHYWSSTNVMSIVYYISPDGLSGGSGFTLTFTALSKGKNCTGVDRFLCGNSYCIWSGLTCDGHSNCGDMSDEDAQGNSKCGHGGSGVLIVLAVLIVFALLLMCVVTMLCSKNETVRRFSTGLRSRTLSFIPKIR